MLTMKSNNMDSINQLSFRKKRIIFIDVYALFGLLSVILGNSFVWYVVLYDINYNMFHMPLFMFASGYVYIATKKDGLYSTFFN